MATTCPTTHTPATTHVLTYTDTGADCSCGRRFIVKDWSHRTQNVTRANARRHANAANAKLAPGLLVDVLGSN